MANEILTNIKSVASEILGVAEFSGISDIFYFLKYSNIDGYKISNAYEEKEVK